jgi:hypothetical protein
MSTTNTNKTPTTDSPPATDPSREPEAPHPPATDPAGPPPTGGSGDSGDIQIRRS